ncbi:phosphatidylinositol N-acetylglucosaminyltransferase subunit Q [Neocloeon triangulifer]|uniref:phosphatidylinositol N-acetylglucosaminyltransferase subunit Q n=1 Tax=Neocloeon triangulifer TaxID=2078957 RepID=UPI00286F3DD3|nr:phosphatidylinositol N-acetylglucosaminyltransferase subunit Q [Neocloeon triangulifer]
MKPPKEYIKTFLSHSSSLTHLHNLSKGLVWSCQCLYRDGRNSIAALNHLTAALIDCVLGVVIIHYFLNLFTAQLLVDWAMSVIDEGVVLLRSLLSFLMGSPAGLKLNTHLNRFLGKFFIYNVNLWWVFLDHCQPVLSIAFHALQWLGFLGITTHIAIIADLIALASFHAYCIYVYAARFCSLQLKALVYLWRLFLGRKWNPQRQCVDSFDYPPSQLFVGVLLFTVLIYSLPTTTVYYVFFTTIRLLFFVINGILARVRYFIRTFPIFITIAWLFSHKYVCTNTVMMVNKSQKPDVYKVELIPSRASLCHSVRKADDECTCVKPQGAEWLKTLKNIITAKLF